VLVVDNASADGSVGAIRAACPEAEVVVSTANVGFAGGNNLGVAHASVPGDALYLFLNNDTVVEPDFLEPLVAAMESDARIGAAGGTICYYPDTERVWYAGGRLAEARALALHRHYRKSMAQVRDAAPMDVTFLTGCLLLVRARVVQTLGAFDERFFMYFEDAEFSVRLRRHGHRLVYVPGARIYHKISHAGNTATTAYYGLRSRLVFIHNCLAPRHRILAYLYLSVTQSIRLLQWGLVRPDLFRALLAAIRDYRRGVTGPMPQSS
jgi:GT2 family glycosyltransferase